MILVVNDYNGLYGRFWSHLGEITREAALLFRDPERIQLVCFTGGEDVSPRLYGHQNLDSHCSPARDAKEALIFEMAKKHHIPMTGICRGSQFLNVMCGGTIVQDLRQSHGGGRHLCQTYDGQEFEVTSSHHQMSVPGRGGDVLAHAAITLDPGQLAYAGSFRNLANLYTEEGEIKITEAFLYRRPRIFAVQHHPEFQDIDQEAPQWTLQKIQEFCLSEPQVLEVTA